MKTKNLFKSALIALMANVTLTMYADQPAYPAMGSNKLNVATLVNVGETWGSKWNYDYKIATIVSENAFTITLYPKQDEAWNYLCRIKLKNFVVPTKKIDKNIKKNKDKKGYFYDCDVEFFYNVQYPSIEECFANYGGFVVNAKDKEAKKRTVEGHIFLNPYFFTAGDEFGDNEDEKMFMNLWFDQVGFQIYFLEHLEFELK